MEDKMKKVLFVSAVLFTVFSANLFSQSYDHLSPAQFKQAEQNYLKGLSSEVHGVRVSSAYFLGEMKSAKAVIPLMKIFQEEKNEGAKLVVAWSLLKIGDERGIYAVEKYADSKDCAKIRCILQFLYTDHLIKTSLAAR
jgi:hypothetical protein